MSLDASLRLLRAFVGVAQEGNVGRAAQRLYVSQPSLSQDIRRLERQITVALFTRTARGMSLTPSGRALLHGVEAGLLCIDRAAEDARVLGGVERRTVSVAFTPSVANKFMPSLMQVLDRILPQITVDDREVDTGDVEPGVRGGRYDLGLAHCPVTEPDLTTTLLAHERLCALVSSDNPLAHQRHAKIIELDGLDLLLWPRETAPDYYDHILETCRLGGITPSVVPGPRRAIIRSYLLVGQPRFCLLPESTAQLTVPGAAFVQLVDDHARVPLVSVRRKDDQREDILMMEKIAKHHCDNLLPDLTHRGSVR